MKKLIIWVACAAIAIYIAACAYLFISQKSIIFVPDKQYIVASQAKLPDIIETQIITQSGLKLNAWFNQSQNGEYVLYFNGNKSGMHLHEDFYEKIIKAGYGLLAFNYRGYGTSEGEPSELGLYEDARAAIALLQQKEIPLERVIFLGRSLGTGVAVQMATEYLPRAVVLVSPYTSMADMGKIKYPLIPINFLLTEKFASLQKAPEIASPTLIFHGRDDAIIPLEHAEKMHSAIKGSKLFIYDGQDHNNLDFTQIMKDVDANLANK